MGSNAEFERTIIIQNQEDSRKYLIAFNLLCLPIKGVLNEFYKNMDQYDNGLDFFMSNEVNCKKYKLQMKNKAISHGDALYGHSVIYVNSDSGYVYLDENGEFAFRNPYLAN